MTLTPENREKSVAELLAWFRDLRIEIPMPEPVVLRWTDGGHEEIAQADYDEDSDDLWIDPDQPTLKDLAHGVLSIIERCSRTFPGPRNWHRWRITSKTALFLYASGICSNGGSASMDGMDPHRTMVYQMPGWKSILPRKDHQLRPYVLWRSRDWWQHLRHQGWPPHRLTPEGGGDFGWCEKCYPAVPE